MKGGGEGEGENREVGSVKGEAGASAGSAGVPPALLVACIPVRWGAGANGLGVVPVAPGESRGAEKTKPLGGWDEYGDGTRRLRRCARMGTVMGEGDQCLRGTFFS